MTAFRFVRASGLYCGLVFLAALPSARAATKELCRKEILGIHLETGDIAKRLAKIAQQSSPAVEVLRGSVQANGVEKATYNWALRNGHNSRYSTELPVGPMTNQCSSGRCWIFSGLNLIRTLAIRDQVAPPEGELSQTYTYFYSLLEKSNRELEAKIDKLTGNKLPANLRTALAPAISDGGWFEWFFYLAEKYGVVPKDAMPDPQSARSSAALLEALKVQLGITIAEMSDLIVPMRMDGGPAWKEAETLNRLREIKSRGIQAVLEVLITHLGAPPTSIEVGGMRLTPLEYRRDLLQFNPRDYVAVGFSPLPNLQRGQVYQLTDSGITPKNGGQMSQLSVLNVSLERMEELVKASLDRGIPVPFAADISESRDTSEGVGILNSELYRPEAAYNFSEPGRSARMNRENGQYYKMVSANHAMVFVGYDQPVAGAPVVKFKVENSWGDKSGREGFLAMYRNWFVDNMYVIVVNRSLLTGAERRGFLGDHQKIEQDRFF